MKKLITLSHLKEIMRQIDLGEISWSRGAEMLSDIARERHENLSQPTLTIAYGHKAKPGDTVWNAYGERFIVMLGSSWFFLDFITGNLWSEIRHENLYAFDPTTDKDK